MKTTIYLCTLFTIIFLLSSTQPYPDKKGEYFRIEVIQNDSVISPVDHIISLEKAPFKFRVTLFKTDGVDFSASWGTYYYDYPDNKNIYTCDNDDFEGCRFVAIKTGIEDKFNVNKDICVGDGDYQYHWFYKKDMDWHRFDKGVIEKEGMIIAEMTVENIFDCDARDCHYSYKTGDPPCGKHEYKVEEIEKDIYIVFATSQYAMMMTEPSEVQREKFILTFR